MSAAEWDRQVLARIGQMALAATGQPGQTINAILDLALSHRLHALAGHLYRACGGAVQHGPFAGMRYLPQAAGSLLPPKLLGCYEAELHDVWGRVTCRPYHTVVNVGCGEGYYAVGLARLLPAVQVFAFDCDPRAQELCLRLAALNGVAGRVAVAGECGTAQLQELARPRTLIVCDCEGGETALLDPARVPGLAVCDLVVELHDFLAPQTSRQLTERFAATHDATLISNGGRDPNAYPLLRGWGQFDQALAVLEGRPGPTPWAFLTAHAAPRP
jgi:hypothetical protein